MSEKWLQELLGMRSLYESRELARHLYECRSAGFPSWQPLLDVAIEQAIARGEPAWDIFYGLMPNQAHPPRNTEGMSGPRHPQMKKS